MLKWGSTMLRYNVRDCINGWVGTFETTGTIGIKLSDLKETDKGRGVIFHTNHGSLEYGIVSSWNDRYIFVRFTTGSTAAACDPEQLEFTNPLEDNDG